MWWWQIHLIWVDTGMNEDLKSLPIDNYPDSKSDLFAMFIERNLDLVKSAWYGWDDYDAKLDVPFIL